MVDKNLFLYDLAVVAIFKNEGRYLKEWLDYHLLAGVDHFYLYNNGSTDDYKKILAPYVEANLVTLTEFPGKVMQHLAYIDAIEKFRFESRFMAFIDLDEFIFPKTNQKISEVVDEILSGVPNAAALAVNWQLFGSNGHEKADYSRGVLERFTRRASKDRLFWDDKGNKSGTALVKTIANPRLIRHTQSPHHAVYFDGKSAVNSNAEIVPDVYNFPVRYEKIVVNHYCIKSREEFLIKQTKGRADTAPDIDMNYFINNDQNEIFDDGILKYRAECAENFSFESEEQKISRVINSLVQTLTQNPPTESKLETFLTCRAVAEKFQIKIGDTFAEEIALAWIHKTLSRDVDLTFADLEFLIEVLPEIISRPFPLTKKILQSFLSRGLPAMLTAMKNSAQFLGYKNLSYLQRFLKAINEWR